MALEMAPPDSDGNQDDDMIVTSENLQVASVISEANAGMPAVEGADIIGSISHCGVGPETHGSNEIVDTHHQCHLMLAGLLVPTRLKERMSDELIPKDDIIVKHDALKGTIIVHHSDLPVHPGDENGSDHEEDFHTYIHKVGDATHCIPISITGSLGIMIPASAVKASE